MSSGNLLADRRMEFARDLFARGDGAAALDLLGQALVLVPDWVEGWFQQGAWCAETGARDDAVAAFARCLALDAADRMGAAVRLALLGAAPSPDSLPPAYVAALFDDYADRFDEALVERLRYAVPEGLHALVAGRASAAARFARAIDLGCGTGLAGERFRAACAWLEGVDLSAGMIAKARRKGFYDALAEGDAVGWLEATPAYYDLILAADVLVYLGDLSALFAAVARALTPGGRFAFSVEAADGDGFRLTAGQRFAHSAPYLRSALAAAGLTVEALEDTHCRLEAGRALPGYLVLARRPDGAALTASAEETAAIRRISA
jgi:predicted TPR repeat methyltransferase